MLLEVNARTVRISIDRARRRLVGAGLMRGVDSGFQLEGRVLDVEVADEAALELIEETGGVPVVEAGVFDDDMRGQGWLTGGDRPGVQIVYSQDVRHFGQVRAEVF
jgi:hypothetical protein